MFFAIVMTVAIIALPFIVLPPVIDRLFAPAQFRAIVRRIFKIDSGATIADIPDRVSGARARPSALTTTTRSSS